MKKVILVTGASSGIGKETARQLSNDGHIVYGAARRIEKMKDLQAKGVKTLKMDITDENDIETVVNTIIANEGRIDVLVNNAGYAIYGAVEDTATSDIRRQFDVNFFGLVQLTQKVLPNMREQGSGKIINMSSMGGKMYTPLGSFYHATKHALEGWSDCLRLELNPLGIDVIVIQPGAIKTEFSDVLYDPMVERSKGGAYEDMAMALAKATKVNYEKPNSASKPTVISSLISRAIKANKPKTRYAAGKYAKPMMWIRKYLGDRIFDRVIMSQV